MPIQAMGFVPFGRVDDEKRMVEGVITSEAVDSYDTRFDYDATKRTIFADRGFNYWRNLRAMHAPIAAGVVDEINCDDTGRKVSITARVVDNAEWEKVKAGVYKGFSIGGVARASVKEKVGEKDVIRFTDYDLMEVSLVDRPSNPDAEITLFRVDLDDAAYQAKWDAMSAAEISSRLMDLLTGKIASGSVEDALLIKTALDSAREFLNKKITVVSESADKLAQVAAASASVVEEAEGEIASAETPVETRAVNADTPAQGVVPTPFSLPPEPELITPETVVRAISANTEFTAQLISQFMRGVLASPQFLELSNRVAGSEGRLAALESRARTIETNNRVAGPVLREVTQGGNANAEDVNIAALRSAMNNTSDLLAKQAIQQEIARLEIGRVHSGGGKLIA